MHPRKKDELNYWPSFADMFLALSLVVVVFWLMDRQQLAARVKLTAEATVPAEDYHKLKSQYDALQQEHEQLKAAHTKLQKEYRTLWEAYEILKKKYEDLQKQYDKVHQEKEEMVWKAVKRPNEPIVKTFAESQNQTFESSRATLSKAFEKDLQAAILGNQEIEDFLQMLKIEDGRCVIEVIGHTDGTFHMQGGDSKYLQKMKHRFDNMVFGKMKAADQKNEVRELLRRVEAMQSVSNFDGQLGTFVLLPEGSYENTQKKYARFSTSSNAELGLLRALSVANYIRSLLLKEQPEIAQRVQFRVYSAAHLISPDGNLEPAKKREDLQRRRVELRITEIQKKNEPE